MSCDIKRGGKPAATPLCPRQHSPRLHGWLLQLKARSRCGRRWLLWVTRGQNSPEASVTSLPSPSSHQEQQAHLCRSLLPPAALLGLLPDLDKPQVWKKDGRAESAREKSEDPGITAQNISCTLHGLRDFLQLLVLLPGTGRAATPASAWSRALPQLVWAIPFMLDTPQPFLAVTAHMCNQTCSSPYPVLHDLIPYQLLLISFVLSLLASFRHKFFASYIKCVATHFLQTVTGENLAPRAHSIYDDFFLLLF